MRRSKDGTDRPWGEKEQGAAYREPCRKLARDELSVGEFDTEVGKLAKAAAKSSPYGDPFAPLTLADPPAPPTPVRQPRHPRRRALPHPRASDPGTAPPVPLTPTGTRARCGAKFSAASESSARPRS